MRYFVYPYKYGSRGAKALAKELKGSRLKNPDFTYSMNDVFINWGNGEPPTFFDGDRLLNLPVNVRVIANKLKAFILFKAADVPIPRFSLTKEGVTWPGKTVVRHKLTGHSGEGIEIVDDPSQLPTAPLYVEYIKKKEEYRVHVGKILPAEGVVGEVCPSITTIAIQRKARRIDVPDSAVNWQVRNHDNGFVFVRNNVSPPSLVVDAAKQALIASGLDFGAVDVIWNGEKEKAFVLEINTAPGIEGTTIKDYGTFFSNREGS